MIEIYLATLLIGIGTIYQKSQTEKKEIVKSKVSIIVFFFIISFFMR